MTRSFNFHCPCINQLLKVKLNFQSSKSSHFSSIRFCCFEITACPSAPSIPALPGHTSCSLASFCSGVVCCTDVALLKSSIQSEVKIDRCKGKVFITLEKLEVVIILTKFEFSTWQKYTLQNVFRLE